MTAEKVGALAVVAEEPALSPLSTPDRPVFFTRIVRLLLEDGTETHGCTECDFAGSSGAIRAHLASHNGGRRRRSAKVRRSSPVEAAVGDLRIADLLNSANQIEALSTAIEKLAADRNEWKARALKAERDIAALRRVLGGALS